MGANELRCVANLDPKGMVGRIYVGDHLSSLKHAYVTLTPLNPYLYSKTGVYRGIHYLFLFLLKNKIVGTR